VYYCSAHDPEGALGALSAAWVAWLGLVAGRVLVRLRASGLSTGALGAAVAARWLPAGLLLCTLAGALCGWAKEGGAIPVNKNLWSPSFALLLAGFGYFCLTFMFLMVAIRN
jgi:heparan-alpha-glucosaminide N-acetyltransferase